ncbi:CcmD family protein [Halobiforma nitratireducens]|uniref:Ccm operon protein n=1 Tax=Halobiforma nitratireducens JCM 10879 TaxID=1227454 RepID=M0L8Y3_9EURY|nr:CcmD family protein [Halobiforma nitratireducens]EMA30052.1 ccm operon protein [Halobiforma nitratireducens JCM 10879]
MDYLLLFAYGTVFGALVIYVFYLRNRLSELEQRLEDVTTDHDSSRQD